MTSSRRQDLQLVDLRDVVKAYPSPVGDVMALRGVDLEVEAGEFVAVIGKSGSGKSTLINAIAGIDRPTSGEVLVAGTAVHELDENAVAKWRGANLGVIFQFFQLLPTLTLVENIVLPMEFARRGSPRQRRERALALLERVEMGDHAGKLPSELSGGQQQRVAIARALANDPALIVADEPTGSLDSRTADTVFQLFEELVDQGKTILMVTHDSDLAGRASRVVLIADGEVVEEHVRSALAGISEDDLADVSTRLEPLVVGERTTIFSQGDEADRFYIIVRGSMEVLRTRADGTEDLVEVLHPGQYFGEVGLLHGTPRTVTVRVSADADASLLALDGEDFRRLVADNELAHGAIAKVMRQRMTAETVRQVMPGATFAATAGIHGSSERLEFAAGETILRPGDPFERFFVVTEGMVEIMSNEDPEVAYRIGQGRHFGRVGLSREGRCIVTLRASPDEPAGTAITAIPIELHRDLTTLAALTDDHIALLVAEAGGA